MGRTRPISAFPPPCPSRCSLCVCVRSPLTRWPATRCSPPSTVDFLTTAEWHSFFTQFRSRLTVALRHATARRPATLANALQAIGSAVHRRVAATGGDDIDSRGDLTPASEPARLLEAYSTFVDAVCAGLPFAVVKSKPPQAAAQGRGKSGKGKKKKKKGQPPQPKGAPSVDRGNEVDEATYHAVRRSLSTVVQAVVRCAGRAAELAS